MTDQNRGNIADNSTERQRYTYTGIKTKHHGRTFQTKTRKDKESQTGPQKISRIENHDTVGIDFQK